MTARIEADDIAFLEAPVPRLLRAATGIEPVPAGTDVRLDTRGVRSTQRLAAGFFGDAIVAGLWPAELKNQATYLYGGRHGQPLVEKARALGWTAEPSPHLAFRNSAPSQRLYMRPSIDAAEYARRWEEGDLGWVGQHDRDEVRSKLWPWLKSRGYARDADDPVLDEWLRECLGRRPAFMRPGLRLKRQFPQRGSRPGDLAQTLRRELLAIFDAAGEQGLRA